MRVSREVYMREERERVQYIHNDRQPIELHVIVSNYHVQFFLGPWLRSFCVYDI